MIAKILKFYPSCLSFLYNYFEFNKLFLDLAIFLNALT